VEEKTRKKPEAQDASLSRTTTQDRSTHQVLNKTFPEESPSHEKEFSPPQSPPLLDTYECVDVSSSEKIYISMVKRARENDKDVDGPFERNREIIEKKKEEEDTKIYNNLNSVIKPTSNTIKNKHIQSVLMRKRRNPLRHSYRTTAIKGRCRQFAQDFHDLGFPIGIKISKNELHYRMITLDLCHDRVTVNQYFERLVMYGYFKILPNGLFEFRSVLPVGQQALPNPKTTMHRLDSVLNPLPQSKKSW